MLAADKAGEDKNDVSLRRKVIEAIDRIPRTRIPFVMADINHDCRIHLPRRKAQDESKEEVK